MTSLSPRGLIKTAALVHPVWVPLKANVVGFSVGRVVKEVLLSGNWSMMDRPSSVVSSPITKRPFPSEANPSLR